MVERIRLRHAAALLPKNRFLAVANRHGGKGVTRLDLRQRGVDDEWATQLALVWRSDCQAACAAPRDPSCCNSSSLDPHERATAAATSWYGSAALLSDVDLGGNALGECICFFHSATGLCLRLNTMSLIVKHENFDPTACCCRRASLPLHWNLR